MRGYRLINPNESLAGERALLAAILLVALKDAERGDKAAAAWLDKRGCAWLELLGLEVQDWRQAAPELLTMCPMGHRREPMTAAERSRRYYERRKEAQRA